jgi:hypothetical protein
MFPDTEEHLLRNILGFGGIAQHSAGKADHARKMATNDLCRRASVAGADTSNEVLVWVPHGLKANSAQRRAVTNGRMVCK